ncbi:MAG: hypothetical protein AB1485_00850 [Candidatus Thermoplasmatota archaeon]
MIEFPYQKEFSELFGEIFRPLAEFEIETSKGWIPIVGYVDSGADVTLLPRSFLKPLKVKIEKSEIKEIRGIGEGRVPVIIKNVGMKIGDKVFNAKIAVALIEDVPYILGREDVFEKFEIIFCQEERVVRFI